MCADENYSLYEYGNIEDLENMGSKNLYTHYKKVMSTSPIDIIAVGNLEHDGLKDVIKNIFQLKVDQVEIVENEFKKVTPTQIKEVKEKMDISQGKLTLGYRTNLPYDDPLYPALMVYSSILGGGAHSKLFLKVREEKSLCYYIFSRIDRFKSLMFISSGIETNKFQIAKDVIMDQLLEMEKGNITDQEMEYAKKTLINSIKSLKDSGDTMAEYLYSQIFAKRIESLEKVIQEIEGVTVDQIIEVAKKINLDTVYFLTNEEV